jgi:hypothetical protein
MRILLWTTGSLIAAAALPALPAQAAPSGSYRQSCNSVRDDGRQITAECRDVRGRYNPTSLDYRNCQGDIGNNNGQLVCNGGRPGSGWGGGDRPGNGGDRPGYGGDRPGNGNGWDRPGNGNGNGGGGGRPGNNWGGNNGGRLPGGSWLQSCRNADMRGTVLTAECRSINKKWRETRIDTRSCRGDAIGNMDGRLFCN